MQKSITVERKIYLWVTLASTASRVGEIVDNSFLFQNIAFTLWEHTPHSLRDSSPNLGEQSLLTNCNFQNQPKILTKKVKNLDKRNFHSRERFSVWHEAEC